MLQFYPPAKRKISLYYKKFLRILSTFFNMLKLKITQPFNIFLILCTIAVCVATFSGANFIVELTHDPELLELMPNWMLQILLSLPVLLIYINLLILLPIIVGKIKKKAGTLLRFRIISFLFIAITVPAIVFAFIFIQILNFTFESFNHSLLLKKTRQNLNILEQEIFAIMQKTEKDTLIIAQKNHENRSKIRWNFVEKVFYFSKEELVGKNLAEKIEKKYADFFTSIDFELLLSIKKNYTSYEKSLGIIYSIVENKKNHYVVGIKKIGPEKANDIRDILSILKRLRQLDLLAGPLKIGVFIFLLYFYIQIFCAMVIISYYFSNRYLAPLQDLILTIRILSLQEKSIKTFSNVELKRLLAKLNHHVKKMSKDELRDLLQSFNEMIFELQQSRIRIAQISEMEGWQEVAKRIAHEIKNPLTPIKLATSQIEKILIKENLNAYEQLLPSLNLINHEVEHISKLTDDFSYFSKNMQIKKKWYKFSTILASITDFLQQRNDIVVKVSVGKLPLLFIDNKKIYQLLLNLVKNSLESLDESKVPIKKIFLYAYKLKIENKPFVEINVLDNGQGIPKKEKEKIFKPYFTLKERGTGLGLAICQQIALAHNAQIFLKRNKKNLTCFTLRIPLEKKKRREKKKSTM